MIIKVGLKVDGEVLLGYVLSNLFVKIIGDMWFVMFYVDNLFDKYVFIFVCCDKFWVGML